MYIVYIPYLKDFERWLLYSRVDSKELEDGFGALTMASMGS